ncbi:unnamed protein product [Prorocentrum cordatum]|uniref:Exostosin GT47 domain-containing protein n=1 Tax=Prorocentrum cordatum TaxID=2364126 RepID=A0ABN9PE82_9DINO|nr:unnamed protein product [Polarella glacialis]
MVAPKCVAHLSVLLMVFASVVSYVIMNDAFRLAHVVRLTEPAPTEQFPAASTAVAGTTAERLASSSTVNDGLGATRAEASTGTSTSTSTSTSTTTSTTTSTGDMASDQVVVNIGTSLENNKCVNATSSVSCDVDAAQHGSRLNRDLPRSTDEFHVFAYGSRVCVKRTDDVVSGWGMNLTIRCTRSATAVTSPITNRIPRRHVQAWLEEMYPKPEPQLLHARLSFQNTSAFPDKPLVSIAAMCDWLFIQDTTGPRFPLQIVRLRSPPRTIFLDLRLDLKMMIRLLKYEVFPYIDKPVVVLTTSQDRTIPQQRDRRFENRTHDVLQRFARLLNNRLIERWVTENFDDSRFHKKLAGIPTGFYTPNCEIAGQANQDCSQEWWSVIKAGWLVPLSQRPLTLSCNGRHHKEASAGQFTDRVSALKNCRSGGPWGDFSELRGEMFSNQFAAWWQNHSFVICPHGGGLDPSPRAFMAIASGAIPIVQSTPCLDTVYSQLPVAFVRDWKPASISVKKLQRWRDHLAPQYEDPELVAKVIAKLTMKYWWEGTVNRTVRMTSKTKTKNTKKDDEGRRADSSGHPEQEGAAQTAMGIQRAPMQQEVAAQTAVGIQRAPTQKEGDERTAVGSEHIPTQEESAAEIEAGIQRAAGQKAGSRRRKGGGKQRSSQETTRPRTKQAGSASQAAPGSPSARSARGREGAS